MSREINHIFRGILLLLSSLMIEACSDTPVPENIIPTLHIQEAFDVTRSEATVALEIDDSDLKRIDYVKFRYGKNEWLSQSSMEITELSNRIELTLTGLEAGQKYFFRAEGGNVYATVESDTSSFTTVPNSRPVISKLTPLSRGPVGIIISFEILDNGGSEIRAAGCRVVESSSDKVKQFDAEKPIGNVVKLYISNLSQLTQYRIIPFAENNEGETEGEEYVFETDNSLILKEAGIMSLTFGDFTENLDELKISGKMNGDDFHFLRRMLKAPLLQNEQEMTGTLHSIDLSDVRIVEGGGAYDGARFTENDVISKDLFAECQALESVALPMSAVAMEKDALRDCTELQSLEIPAGITQLLPSSGCTALREIVVSVGNDNYRSIDGVLFDAEASEILWFPLGKEGDYVLPESVISIGEYAFNGTNISSIVLPENLKSLGRAAFANSMLREITLPNSITNIPYALFQNSTQLVTVRLGNEANYISDYAFDVTALQHLYLPASPPVVSTNALYHSTLDLYTTCVIHVPVGSKTVYRYHSKWGNFEKIEEY